MKIHGALTILAMMLSACGSNQPADSADQKTQLEEQLSTQMDALEKSKQVEDEVLKAAEERRKAMQEQGI